jgi:hypothetical protein
MSGRFIPGGRECGGFAVGGTRAARGKGVARRRADLFVTFERREFQPPVQCALPAMLNDAYLSTNTLAPILMGHAGRVRSTPTTFS